MKNPAIDWPDAMQRRGSKRVEHDLVAGGEANVVALLSQTADNFGRSKPDVSQKVFEVDLLTRRYGRPSGSSSPSRVDVCHQLLAILV